MSTNTFTDDDGDVYSATRHGKMLPKVTLSVHIDGDPEPVVIDFWVRDASKIIALIAEAATDKPVPQTPEQIAAFARRWDARVVGNLDEPTEDMGQ